MSGLKAVVLEKKGSMLTVLSSDGSFQKIRYKGSVEVGEEIEIANSRRIPMWRIGVSVAAIFFLVFMGGVGWNILQPATAVAMLSVDINPSLQLTLDRKGRVLELEPLNPDAEQLLSELSLKGEPWKEALSQIIGQSVKLHYLNPEHTWVLVGYSPLKLGADLAKTEMDSATIMESVEGTATHEGISPQVAVYELTVEEQRKARESGLTLGEYALVNTAQKAGISIDPGTVKQTEERMRLLETPEVQEQMRKENRIKKEVQPALPAFADSQAEKDREDGFLRGNQENQENKEYRELEKGQSERDPKQPSNNKSGINVPSLSNLWDNGLIRDKKNETEKKNTNETDKDKKSLKDGNSQDEEDENEDNEDRQESNQKKDTQKRSHGEQEKKNME